MAKGQRISKIATEHFESGIRCVRDHQLFGPVARRASFYRASARDVYPDGSPAPPKNGWAVVDAEGNIIGHPTRAGSAQEWAYVFAHCLLHLAFGHHIGVAEKREWRIACCATVTRFLRDLKFGKAPEFVNTDLNFSARDERSLCRHFVESGIDDTFLRLSVAGDDKPDMLLRTRFRYSRSEDWQLLFAEGLKSAVQDAVRYAGGYRSDEQGKNPSSSKAEQSKRWFVNSYPLLGALATAFRLIESHDVCNRERIPVAAVNPELQELYVNSAAKLSADEYKFVMAHEFMHVGLRHETRCQGRDPYLWNVACDYVINGWLIEMGVGVPPSGILHDPELKGMSAESVYDRIVTDLRRARKLCTLRGNCDGAGDIISGSRRAWWEAGEGVGLDEFYRRCLAEGLRYHQEHGRGYLPAGLIEEINALSQPPIPWDVELAQWFDEHFPPVAKNRTYARPSRRQSSTPDIPRPRYLPATAGEGRTFAVILDTSGSMDRTLLAKALGAIASYSVSRDVPAVRVVFCDAAPYDQGYLAPTDIAGMVKVKGRGGTVLQPAVDLLERAQDFPQTGPILIITDGACDVLRIQRTHAFLLPASGTLPFFPHGRVFRIK